MNAKVFSTHTVRLCAGIFLLISLLSVNLTAAVRYVKQGGTGNGSTWGNASGDLQAMINASGAGDQVWVAAGTYSNGLFVMKNGVEILGGFPNTGNPGLGARNWIAHVTTLSGGSNVIRNVFTIGSPLIGTAVLDGFTITGSNGDVHGGGMYNIYASPTVRNCVFSGNTALQGAGMWNENSSSPTVTNCVFSGNFCDGPGLQYGAGMGNRSSSPTVTNCLFINNVAGSWGSGMYNDENSDPLVLNCTFSGNTSNIGSAIYNRYAGCNPTIKNCIIWGNDGGITDDGASSTVTYSIVQGGFAGTGNLSVDPLFVSMTDFHLQNGSPAINAGTASGAPATDFDGDARPQGGGFDMGYDEFFLTCPVVGAIWYVNAAAAPGGNGASWDCAFQNLQQALTAAGSGHEIWVAAGTYVPTAYPTGCSGCSTNRDKAFLLKDGVKMYGGFPNTGNPGPGDRDPDANTTILSGDFNGDDVGFTNNSENAYHVVFSIDDGSATELNGFTIRGGNANDETNDLICIEGACQVRNLGGGMVNSGGTLTTIRDCKFLENNTLRSGGGMLNTFNSSPSISDCVFSGNQAENGGGMNNFSGSSPTVVNCAFWGNVATLGGAVRNNTNSNASFVNCSFSGNDAGTSGGAMYNNTSSSSTLKNCILWGNSSEIVNSSSTPTVTYSIVQGGYAGTGNLNVDPLFVSQPPIGLGTTGDLQLQACSPAIDAGTSMGAPTTDILGNARVDAIAGGNSVDMGAYEYQSTLQTEIEITSVTSTPIICQNDGSITAVGSATCQLVGTITYSINGVGGNTANTTGIFNGLPNGNYTVTVYDNGNPTNFNETTVTVDISASAPVVTAAATAALCSGGNGQITLTVVNGIAPYDYVWNGPGANDGSVINVVSHIITPAPPGTYAITATDANGCETTTSSIVTEPVTNVQGNGMVIADGDAMPSLSDHTDFGTTSIGVGFARTFTIQNTGSAPFAISSITSNNTRFAVSGAPASVAANSSATFTVTFTPTATGAQNATITVNNGNCVYDFAVTGNGACPAITITAPTITQPTCATPTGTIVVNATGSGALEYSVDNGMNWDTDPSFGGLTPGNYNVKVRLQANPSCETNYGSNPVVLASPFTASTTTDIWTGCVSTNWATPGNWADGSVPTAADDVTIPNVANDPVIMGGTAAVAKSVLVQASAVFTIQATGSLAINGATGFALETFGNFDNFGTLLIGNVSSVANRGIVHRNGGTLNNKPGGLIQIDRTSVGEAFYTSGIVNNDGTVTIGSLAAVEDIGLSLDASGVFNNNAGGTLNIDRSDLVGIVSFGSINNYGALNIGLNANIGQDGIQNQGNFVNAATGSISGSKFISNGIWNFSGSFQNSGKITFANTVGNGNGNGILSYVPFTNNAGAEIHLDHMLSGIVTTSTFNNAGLIRVGETGPLVGYGINNTGGVAAVFNNNAGGDISIKQTGLDGVQNETTSTFNNNACATLSIFDNLNNSGAFTNAGLFTVNTTQAHTNSALTNNGIIAYPQGNPIPNVTNNEIIIAPTTANACDVISPAFGLGSPVDFTIVGIFTDEAATMSAGTYVTATNTFTPTTILTEGVRTYYVKVMDGNGGCTRVIPWQLTTENCCDAPQAICKTATIVLTGNSASLAVADVNNGSTADCGLQTITVSPNSFNCSHVGTPQTVTLTITDVKGISASCQTTVMVQDNTAPSITCPATQTLVLGANCTATLPNYTSLATTGDNCGVQGVTQSPEAGTPVSGAGNMTVTLTVTDINGNPAQCSFTVTKVDNTPPTITCPATQTLVLGANCTATLPNYTSLATTGDNCGVQGVTQSPEAGTPVSGAGNMTVTLTVTDINGNPAQCSFTVTKVDNTPPMISCPTTKTLVLGPNCTAALPNYTNLATTGDNCGVQGVTQSPAAGTSVSGTGNMTVTLTVTDVNGLTSSCQFTVTKMDETPPTVVCKNTTVFLNASGNYTLLATDVFNATASSDNCSGELTVTNISPATVSCNQVNQTIPVTVTVQDAAGNSATCTAQITVKEGTALPEGWNSSNIGNANGSGGYKPCTTSGQFTVSATGFSTSSADVAYFTYRELCGNGEIIARVANQAGGGWAGIALRETLAPGSKKVALKTQSNGNIRREVRTVTNGAVNNLNYLRSGHTWLRLVRNGSVFTGYTSTNGTTWDFAFSATISMAGCIYAGVFAESINTNVTTTATFDNVQIIGGTSSLIQTSQTTAAPSTFSPQVYPNPTTGEVNVDLSAYANPVGSVKVFDAYGKLVLQNQLDGSPMFRINLNSDDGVYFLSIEIEGEAPVTKRVVIAH